MWRSHIVGPRDLFRLPRALFVSQSLSDLSASNQMSARPWWICHQVGAQVGNDDPRPSFPEWTRTLRTCTAIEPGSGFTVERTMPLHPCCRGCLACMRTQREVAEAREVTSNPPRPGRPLAHGTTSPGGPARCPELDTRQRLHRGIAVGFNTAAVLSAVRRRFRTEDAEKASATYFRFEALVRFLADEPDCQPCDAVFAAAALEPLAKIDNEITFRRESFLQRVAELQAAKRDGEPACTMPADH